MRRNRKVRKLLDLCLNWRKEEEGGGGGEGGRKLGERVLIIKIRVFVVVVCYVMLTQSLIFNPSYNLWLSWVDPLRG